MLKFQRCLAWHPLLQGTTAWRAGQHQPQFRCVVVTLLSSTWKLLGSMMNNQPHMQYVIAVPIDQHLGRGSRCRLRQHACLIDIVCTLAQARQHRQLPCPVCTRASPADRSTRPRLQQVLDAIDALNSKDPRQTTWDGNTLPYELAYSQWLTDWVLQLESQPSEELQIVARGQHVERWKSPRSDYPEVSLCC